MSVDSSSLEADYRRGRSAHRAGDLAAARASYERVLAADPDHAPALRSLGQLTLFDGASGKAIELLERATALQPDHWRGHALLGEARAREGRLLDARRSYERALALRDNDPELLRAAAAVYRDGGAYDRALELYKAALVRRSAHQGALADYAALLADRGDVKAAVARIAPTVSTGRAGPALLGTYAQLLGRLGRRREGIALLEAALQKRLPDADAMGLHFELANLLDRESSYDLAFYHCQRANNLAAVPFDRAAFLERIDATVREVTRERLAALPAPRRRPGGPRALFVVGLPGSGVRILNRILSAHPKIRDLGESARAESCIDALWASAGKDWPEFPAALDAHAFHQSAVDCVAGRLESAGHDGLFLDGTWRNYLWLGVLSHMFADAVLVECVRDARDVARSCYFRDIGSGEALPFAYDLTNLAAYVNGYRRLMDHWRQVLDRPIHRVSYERLVLDWRRECRPLAEHLGLTWRPEDFQPDAGSAGSAFRLDAKSLRRYRHYRTHLERFVDALDAPPGDPL